MASETPRISMDSLGSPPLVSSPRQGSINEYPFPRYEIGQRPNSRYQPRRGSTSSSIHSIGGALDSGSRSHVFRESGQNGWYFSPDYSGLEETNLLLNSYINSPTTTNSTHWIITTYFWNGTSATYSARYSACYFDEPKACGNL